MGTDGPVVVVEGMEDVISRDLEKHKAELARTFTEVRAFREAKRHEAKKRRKYAQLAEAGKFDADSMRRSLVDIDVNLKHFSDRIEACEAHIVFEKNIVATLTDQLLVQNKALASLAKYRRNQNGSGD